MADQVLRRYQLNTRDKELESIYPGAEVWGGRDTVEQSPVTVIVYPLAKDASAARTTRMLWSAQLRKLFRLSCLPFDPSLVGFKDGGYDVVGGRLVLVMQEARLPGADRWLTGGDGKSCAAQWRGNDLGNRSELWSHLAGLFRALGAVHESGIVHRRIRPAFLLIDENVSRDQPGFLKLGRFEASTFFHQARRVGALPEQDAFTAWYSAELGPSSDRQLVRGTPAGDVYSLLVSAIWLLTGRPDDKELFRFIELVRNQPDQADRLRRDILADAAGKLSSRPERDFFSGVLRHRFSPTATAAHSNRAAEAVARTLRTASDGQSGPLCLMLSQRAKERLDVLWTDSSRTWRDWLAENAPRGRLILGEQRPEARLHKATILLPNGLVLLCSIFKGGGGVLDWQRLVVADVADWTRPAAEGAASLADNSFRLLDNWESPPSNARPWRGLFEGSGETSGNTGSLVHQVQQALEQLNLAELAFWEQNVVPIIVRKVEVSGVGAGRAEEVWIEQLLDAPDDFPINPPIRQQQPPDFSTILQDKAPPIRVELSATRDLWDRDKEGSRQIEPEYEVIEVPERGSGTARSLRLSRVLGPAAPETVKDSRAYFKTEDQGWQIKMFDRRRRAIGALPAHAILSDILRNPRGRQRCVEPAPLKLGYESWSQEKDRLVSNTLATAPLFLVQGPPGTGKSTYITGLMRFILSEEEDPGARLLVVAHMQHAVDDIFTRATARLDRESSPRGWEQPLLLRLRPTGRDRDAERMEKEMAQKAKDLFGDCLIIPDSGEG